MNYAAYMNRNEINITESSQPYHRFVAASVLYAVILLRDMTMFDLHYFVIVGICALAFMLLSFHDIATILVFLLPFAGGLHYHYIVLIAFLIGFAKVIRTGRINKLLIFFFFIGLILGLLNTLTGGLHEEIRTAITLFSYLGLVSLFVCYADKLEIETLIKYFIIGTILSIIHVVYISLSSYSLDYITTYGLRFGRLSDSSTRLTSYDANTIGLFAIAAISLVYLLNRSKHMSTFIASLLITLLVLLGALSISRTYFVLMVMLAIYIIVKNTNRKDIIRVSVLLVIFAGIYFAFIQDSALYDYVIFQYMDRFSHSSVVTYGGRMTIFNHYLNVCLSSIKIFMLGAGINGYKTFYAGISAHNGLQEIILAWGITGFILIASWITMLIRMISQGREKTLGLDLYLPLIMFMLFIQTIPWFSIHRYLVLFAVVLLAINVREANSTSRPKSG